MTTPAVSFNPFATQVAGGTFNVQSDGYVQGTVLDNPAARNYLAGGVLATTETIPMWGGVAISEVLDTGASAGTVGTLPGVALGPTLSRATTVTAPTTGQGAAGQITGFSVFDQAHSFVNTPQSPVPTAGSNNSVHFYRIGSGARIVVAIDPALVSLNSYLITSLVTWDFNNQRLQPYDASTATYALTSMTYGATVAANGPGFTVVAAVATLVGAVGDMANISGATGNTSANGNFVVTAFTDNQHFVVAAPAAVSGSVTGSPVINASVGSLTGLGVKVLETQIGNSMIVQWDPVNLVATWNRAGSSAVIQL